MPTTTSIFIGSRFAGVSARNDRFPRLSEIAACRYLLDLPASSLRAGRIAAALACVPRIKGGGYEVGLETPIGQASGGALGSTGLPNSSDICPNCGRDYTGEPLERGEKCLCDTEELDALAGAA